MTPIVLTAVERVLHDRTGNCLKASNLLMVEHHGLQYKSYCLANLISVLDEVTGMTDRGKACYLDFQKPFDLVNHRLLDRKVKAFGVVAKGTRRWQKV